MTDLQLVKSRHPDYNYKAGIYDYVETVYTGIGIKSLLQQRTHTEPNPEFTERAKITPPDNSFAEIMDSHTGVLFQYPPLKRSFGSLGEKDDISSKAYRLWHNADGLGTNYQVVIRNAGNELNLHGEVYGLVDGVDQWGNVKIHVIPSRSVVNWNDAGTEFLIKRKTPKTSALRNLPAGVSEEYYTLFTSEGYEHFTYRDRRNSQIIGGPDEVVNTSGMVPYKTPYRDISGRPVPPIFKVSIPIKRHIAHNLAQYAVSLWEEGSSLLMGIRKSNFGMYVIYEEDDAFEAIKGQMMKGSSVIQGNPDASNKHEYLQPRMDAPEAKMKHLEQREKRFYRNAFKNIERSSRPYNTAAEVNSDAQESLSAYLSIIALALEEFENQALFMVSQAHFPNQKDKWDTEVIYRKQYGIPASLTIQGNAADMKEANEQLQSNSEEESIITENNNDED